MNKYIIGFLILIIIALLSSLYYSKQNEKISLDNIVKLNNKIITYKLKNDQLVSSNTSLVYTKDMLVKELENSDENVKELADKFHKIDNITKITEQIIIDTIKIVYTDTIKCDFENTGNITTKEYSFNYTSTNNGFIIENLTIPDSLNLVIGDKRKWFLGKSTKYVDISHSNKYVVTNSLQNINIIEEKKWYDSKLFIYSAGILTGILIITR